MVDEVVTDESVHQVTVAGQIRGGDRDDLTLSGCLSQLGSSGKQLGRPRIDQRGRRHHHRVLAGLSPTHDLYGGRGLTADEPPDQPVGVDCCHEGSIDPDADAALTAD